MDVDGDRINMDDCNTANTMDTDLKNNPEYDAFADTNANIPSVQQEEETAPEEERIQFFREVRKVEYLRLKEAERVRITELDKTGSHEFETSVKQEEETAPVEERIQFFREVREVEYLRLKEAERVRIIELEKDGSQEFEDKVKSFIIGVIEEACGDDDIRVVEEACGDDDIRRIEEACGDDDINRRVEEACGDDDIMESFEKEEKDTFSFDKSAETSKTLEEETASEQERRSFSQQVLESEYQKLILAMEHGKIRAIEKIKEEKRQEELRRQFEEFFNVDDKRDVYLQPKSKKDLKRNDLQLSVNRTDETDYSVQSSFTFDQENNETMIYTEIHQQTLDSAYSDVRLQIEKGALLNRPISHQILKIKSLMRNPANKLFKRCKLAVDKETTTLVSDNETEPIVSEIIEDEQKALQLGTDLTIAFSNDRLAADFDDTEEPPRPRLKPFFSEEDARPYLQPMVRASPIPIKGVITSMAPETKKPMLSRLRYWLRKNFCCCYGKNEDN